MAYKIPGTKITRLTSNGTWQKNTSSRVIAMFAWGGGGGGASGRSGASTSAGGGAGAPAGTMVYQMFLAIAITVNQNVTGTLTGYIPAGYYARLRTENNTGTPTFNYRSGQEVFL